jgi:addiction module RelE/StbE family toxin
MRTVVWDKSFERDFKQIVKHKPELRPKLQYTFELLADNPFHSALHTHKLKGKSSDTWACSVDYNNRILFEFIRNSETNEEEINLIALGTHDEVY